MRLKVILILILAYVGAALLFLTLGARGDWGFILAFRSEKLLALTVVAVAIATSTLVFQTLTGNRLLTPAIMGFDALFVLIQTALVFAIGGAGFSRLDGNLLFMFETAVMVLAATLLFGTLLRRSDDLNRMVLTGIVMGIMLNSLTALVTRMIDPSEYIYILSGSYARFNSVDTRILWIATTITVIVSGIMIAMHRRLDVIALGRDAATVLGVEYRRQARWILILVTLQVAVSTALVGPIVFFGLLVSAITYEVAGTWRHMTLLPVSALIAATLLILCQAVFERVLDMQSTVAVVIEGLGGAIFIFMLFRRTRP